MMKTEKQKKQNSYKENFKEIAIKLSKSLMSDEKLLTDKDLEKLAKKLDKCISF